LLNCLILIKLGGNPKKQCHNSGRATTHLPCFLLRSLGRTPRCRLPVYVASPYFMSHIANTPIRFTMVSTFKSLVKLSSRFLQIPLLCFHTQPPWQGVNTQRIGLCVDCLLVYTDYISVTQVHLVK